MIVPVFNLTIRQRWLDLILSGEKREEYRDANSLSCRKWDALCVPELVAHNHGRGAPSVGVYRAGYRLDSYSCAVLVEFVRRPDYRRASLAPAHPEWGEPSGPHWTIGLGPVVHSGTYSGVRKFLENADLNLSNRTTA